MTYEEKIRQAEYIISNGGVCPVKDGCTNCVVFCEFQLEMFYCNKETIKQYAQMYLDTNKWKQKMKSDDYENNQSGVVKHRVKINGYTDRNNTVIALTNAGYTVRVEDGEKRGFFGERGTDYYIVYWIEETNKEML